MKLRIFSDTTIIRPVADSPIFNIREWWRYRELFLSLTIRDIKLRYKNTYIGVLWIVIQPIVSMIIFSFIFGRFAKPNIGNIPYWLFVLFGIVYWNLFSGGITQSMHCLVDNQILIKKVYFPKELLIFSAIAKSVIDFLVSVVILFFGLLISRTSISFYMVGTMICFAFITAFASMGIGFFLSSVNIKYRDVRFIIPFFIQILFFLTPVVYPLSTFSKNSQYVLALNPMVGVINAMHTLLQGRVVVFFPLLFISIISSIVLFLFGSWYFRKTEQLLSDIL
jgi:lipopolysaccharide transport system permease protein